MISKNFDGKKITNKFGNNGEKYVILDGLFEENFVRECSKEFLNIPIQDFVKYENPYFEFGKFAMNNVQKMPEKILSLFSYIHSQEFISEVEKLTGMESLFVDEKRWGGGLHMTQKDGYLAVHKDFNILPTSYQNEEQMLRCINLIGYINENWKEGDGGDLEFWDPGGEECVSKISPIFNRWILFDTRNNYHGHPHPYRGDSPRISIASYYYIKCQVLEEEWTSTEYLKLPWMEESEEYAKARKDRADHKLRYSNLLKG